MPRLADGAARWKALDWRADLGLALCAGVGYAILSQLLFHGRPTGIDEAVSIWQARLLAHGHLTAAVPPHPEAVLTRLTGIGPEGIVGQFSFGTVLLLVPFVLIGQIGLAGPVYGTIGVFCWARLVRRLEPHAGTALGAVLLLAVSPFWAIQSASQLAHVPLLAVIFGIGLALAHLFAPVPSRRAAVWLGLLVGIGAWIRPVEALAAALPAALVVLWSVARGTLPRRVIAQGLLGVSLPLAILFATNTAATGAPLRFGYGVVSGPKHQLGFHEGPDGSDYTPARGLMKLRRQLHGLGEASWESRMPPLWPAAVGILLALPAMTLLEGWLFGTVVCVVLGYWAYWGNAEWLGPRFTLPVLPFLMLAVARLPRLLARWHRLLGVAAALMIVAAVVDGLVIGAPATFRQYAEMDRPVSVDIRRLLIGTPRPGLILALGELKGGNEARLRAAGANVGDARPMVKRVKPCDALWMVRWQEVGVSPPPPVAAAWRAWCTEPDFQQLQLVTADPTGAILLHSVPNRPILRDLGARTALLADSTTFRTKTRLLYWQRIGKEQWRARLEPFNYDSALASWRREDSAFAAGRREVGR